MRSANTNQVFKRFGALHHLYPWMTPLLTWVVYGIFADDANDENRHIHKPCKILSRDVITSVINSDVPEEMAHTFPMMNTSNRL